MHPTCTDNVAYSRNSDGACSHEHTKPQSCGACLGSRPIPLNDLSRPITMPSSPSDVSSVPALSEPHLDAQETRPLPQASQVDNRFLASLVGYNARRASLALVSVFASAVQDHPLKVVEFSMLSLIKANPGITNSALCNTLGLLPPNAVGLIQALTRQGLISKKPHHSDRRASGLFATPQGQALAETLEARIAEAERQHLGHLSAKEQRQLIALLQKAYSPNGP